MDKIADHLIEKETITGKEFMEIYRREKGLPEPEEDKDPKKEEQNSDKMPEQEAEADGESKIETGSEEKIESAETDAVGTETEPNGETGD